MGAPHSTATRRPCAGSLGAYVLRYRIDLRSGRSDQPRRAGTGRAGGGCGWRGGGSRFVTSRSACSWRARVRVRVRVRVREWRAWAVRVRTRGCTRAEVISGECVLDATTQPREHRANAVEQRERATHFLLRSEAQQLHGLERRRSFGRFSTRTAKAERPLGFVPRTRSRLPPSNTNSNTDSDSGTPRTRTATCDES